MFVRRFLGMLRAPLPPVATTVHSGEYFTAALPHVPPERSASQRPGTPFVTGWGARASVWNMARTLSTLTAVSGLNTSSCRISAPKTAITCVQYASTGASG